MYLSRLKKATFFFFFYLGYSGKSLEGFSFTPCKTIYSFSFKMPGRHSSHSETCAVCGENSGERPMRHGVLFENETWMIHHCEPPYGVAGWVTMQTKRHVPGPGHFDDKEALSFGPSLRHLAKLLEEASGAVRIYIAALGEAHPHFHCHLVPRYDDTPVKGWGLFTQPSEAAGGRVIIDESKVEDIVQRLKEALAASPLPE